MAKVIKLFNSSDLTPDYISHDESDTLEEALTDLGWVNDEMLRERIHNKSAMKKARNVYVYALADDRTLAKYHIRMNKSARSPHVVWRKRFDDSVKCIYICRTDKIDHISTDEKTLFDTVTSQHINKPKFDFTKIFLDYMYDLGCRFDGYGCDNWRDSELALLEKIRVADDPERAYWEHAKRLLYERYIVDRNGLRTHCIMMGEGPRSAGYCDYLNPDRWEDMDAYKYPIYWEHPDIFGGVHTSSDMENYNFGYIK